MHKLLTFVVVASIGVCATASADEINGLITKQQFNEIFPLSNGEHLKYLYDKYYQDYKLQQAKAAGAHETCKHLLAPNEHWNGKYQKCIDNAAPELERAIANLNKLRGDFQNCPALMVKDAHGNKVDFSGEAPTPASIHTIQTLYTYENFAQTAEYFPGFLAGDRSNAKRELAAFLANVQQETTGLCFASETPFDILEKLNSAADFKKITNQQLASWMNDEDKKNLAGQGVVNLAGLDDSNRLKVINYVLQVKKPKGKYCQWASNPAGQNACEKSPNYYYGRGAIQLSYPYNYIAFGQSDFVKKNGYDLLANPGLVSDPSANQPHRSSLLWGSAIWFWMTPQAPKPSAHAVMSNQWQPTAADLKNNRIPGFGTVINIINGGLECGASRGADKDIKAHNRIDSYKRILRIIGVPQDDNSKYPLDCKNSNNFNVQ